MSDPRWCVDCGHNHAMHDQNGCRVPVCPCTEPDPFDDPETMRPPASRWDPLT